MPADADAPGPDADAPTGANARTGAGAPTGADAPTSAGAPTGANPPSADEEPRAAGEWATLDAQVAELAGRVTALKGAAGPFARTPTDAEAAAAALAAIDAAGEALLDPGTPEPADAFARGGEQASGLDAARDGVAQLAAGAAVPDPRALAKPLSVWIRGAEKELKGLRRELSARAEQESASRAEQELLAIRRGRLDALREQGLDPYPYAFPDAVPIADVRGAHEGLDAGAETQDRHRVAGRLVGRRDQGGMGFLDLEDRTGRIQLQVREDAAGAELYELLTGLADLGDVLGIAGRAFVSRRGELTLEIEAAEVLAKALRPMPDPRKGLQDPDARYRRREADLLSSRESRATFIARSKVVASIRRVLDDGGFLEVETPILQPLYGGASAEPFTTHHNALDRRLYLRIAPELYLKRCLVGGLERVYEIGRNFRNEGLSPKHNPEFTSIEWYEAYADYHGAAARTEQVVGAAASAAAEVLGEGPGIDFTAPWRRVTFAGSIEDATGIDILEHRTDEALRAAVAERRKIAAGVPGFEALSWPKLADELLGAFVEPELQAPTFVLDHPVELSPLAKAHRETPGLTERWEAYAGGMEIANAFSELNDPDEQRRRFESQVRYSEGGDAEAQPYDEEFVQALEQGMPPAAGVGIGIDRLVMLLTGRSTIRDVVLFPALRER